MLTLDKRQGWQKALDRIRGIERSFQLDPHVEAIVLALNGCGVRTTQSCEGHLNRIMPYPWVRIVETDCGTLQKFLETFYQQHPTDYDQMLMIEHLLDDEYMLRPHGGILQEIRNPDERTKRLKEYLEEIQAFADFLKERFFDER